jgi:hypothetical protein
VSFGTTNRQQATSMNNLNAASATGLTTGTHLFDSGANTLNAPATYYNSILSGGPESTAALAPDVNRTRMAGTQTMQNASTLSPRGGGRGSVLFNTPGQINSQVQSIFNTARPMAAQGALQTGAAQTGAGGEGLNIGTNASNYGFNAGTTIYGQDQAMGGGMASVLGGVLTNPKVLAAMGMA